MIAVPPSAIGTCGICMRFIVVPEAVVKQRVETKVVQGRPFGDLIPPAVVNVDAHRPCARAYQEQRNKAEQEGKVVEFSQHGMEKA